MRHWNGGYISASKQAPTQSSASGIFNLRSQQVYFSANKWPATGELTTSSLALHLDASDTNSYSGSGNTWSDLTSNNLDFTLTNSPTYSSSFGGHFTFDGVDERAEISSGWTNFGTDPFTIEAWYRNHGSVDYATIIGTQAGGANNWQLDFGSNRIRWQSGSGNFVTGTTNTAVIDVWNQVVMVREGTGTNQFKIYLNGVLDTTGTVSTDFNTTSQLRIANNRGGSLYFDGDLSIIRIYKNKALNATEVLGNYNYNKNNFGLPVSGLVTDRLIMHLDAGDSSSYPGSGTTWSDLTANNADATLQNGASYSSSDGGFIDFDGTNDHATVTEASLDSDTVFDGTSSFSICLWLNIDSLPSSTNYAGSPVLFKAAKRACFFTIGDGSPTDKLGFRINTGSWSTPVLSNSLSLNTWYNICVTYNPSSGFILYQNGSSVDTSSTTGSITNLVSTTNTEIAGYTDSSGRYYDGSISSILVYDKALTSTEVAHNYNQIKSRYGL